MSETTVWMVLRKRLVFKPYHHGEHYETPCIKKKTLQITVKNAKSTYPTPWGTARCSRPVWGPSWRIRSRNGVGLLEQIKVQWYITQPVYKPCWCVPSTLGLTVGRPILRRPKSPFCKNAYRSHRKNGRRSAEGTKLQQEIPESTGFSDTSHFKHVSIAFI
jgi:hypothetical protein